MSLLTINKLTSSVGAEVLGVDADRLASDDLLGDTVMQALEDNGVLVFRDLGLGPEAQVELENLFLASDYVRTYTDIACMEAANEAARRAVNCLLLTSGSTASPAQLWPLQEPGFLKPLQEIDRIRFKLHLPHHLNTT